MQQEPHGRGSDENRTTENGIAQDRAVADGGFTLPCFHVVCHSCRFEDILDDREDAAHAVDTHELVTANVDGELHDVEFAEVA